MFNSKKLEIINFLSFFLLIIAFLINSRSYLDSLKFLFYFLILFIGGFGVLNLFNVEFENKNISLIVSLLMGISINIFLFWILKLFQIGGIYSLFIIFFAGIFFIILRYHSFRKRFFSIDIHKDCLFLFVIILLIFSLFLISDNVYYLGDSIAVADPGTPTYELSNAQSLGGNYPYSDLSYSGKELKYHFGYLILLFQLVNSFNVGEINLLYYLMPSFLLILMFFFINELSKTINTLYLRALFILSIFYSSLGIITFVNPPYLNGFVLLATSGNYGVVILMVLALFILIQLDNRFYFLEGIFITSITMTKSPVMIPIAACYLLSAMESLFRKKDLHTFVLKVLAIIPGIAYFFIFIFGTYEQNFWVIFPGYFNLTATNLSQNFLLLNALFSFFIIIIGYIGVGLFFVWYMLKKILVGKLSVSLDKSNYFLFAIILCSFAMGTFLSEVTEGNELVFMTPGYIILSLLTYKLIFNKKNRKLIPVLLILLLLFLNSTLLIGQGYFYQSSKLLLDSSLPKNNNLFANLKHYTVDKAVSLIGFRDRIKINRCHFSNDLINGLGLLSLNPPGIFTFNRLYEPCENYGLNEWTTSSTSGYIRTALSKKQTIVEGHRSKGILSQEDYCNRTFENLKFFAIITGKNDLGKSISLVLNSTLPSFETLSYYSYFNLYHPNNKNYFMANQLFLECMSQQSDSLNLTESKKLSYLSYYLLKYKVSYLLFEQKDKPKESYIEAFGLELIYDSNTVKIYGLSKDRKDYPN